MSDQQAFVYLNQQQKIPLAQDKKLLADVLKTIEIDTATLAVAVNNQVIPRGQWPSYSLCDGDNINLFGAIAGG
ncbi:sulfur carrier protein ThiS [Psychrobium sp. MM17-31]|uniref:sulfur carrier protein ThiS n=1 Tax=Psychrobium sp. MM17-31 TaxID=2917758 RepID=UPI001EF745E8|nr:sulfur carrier protein ThiS [Psychrobium sp. MM17-31]MCG7529806.1 sulfur carrier protein ThiS [Psychrobium sp. MM17-31]